ncbi:hypothetical protein TNCV_687501 [Trichonephila clavipes]|nr:hypothetical protein TNCV_687501 [Trichonephila clavipes]
MGARPVVKSVSMSVWAPWVPTWVVSIKITKKHDLGTGVENSIKLRRVNMIPRRLVNARQRESPKFQDRRLESDGTMCSENHLNEPNYPSHLYLSNVSIHSWTKRHLGRPRF